MNIGMMEESRKAVAEALAHVLADAYALYLETQNYHWNVTGPQFYSLHILFEKQYEDLAEAIDEIAERIRALGEVVDGSFTGFVKLLSVKEREINPPASEMIKNLLQGHELLIRSLRDLGGMAEKLADHATVDLVGRRLNVHEKFAWMLRSH